jgi:phytoene desaturase
MSARRAVIIGGGLGGLAVAVRLAHAGWRVTICERADQLGGKMNQWSSEGFTFDTGPSVITLPWVFAELFRDVGRRIEDYLPMRRLDTLARYAFDDRTEFRYTADENVWRETMAAIAPDDADGFRRFMELGRKLYHLSLDTFLNRPVFGPVSGKMVSALRHFPARHAWSTYADTVDAHFRSPHLRQLYNRYPTYVGSSPYATPATFALIPFMERYEGVWHVDGGLYRIVECLRSIAEEFGAEIRLNADVVHITQRNGRISGIVLADGSSIDADVVVMNGDIEHLDALTGADAPPHSNGQHRSMSGFVMLLGVDQPLEGFEHHNIYFSGNYENEFRELFDTRQFPTDPTVYLSIPSRTDRSLAPGDGETVFVMANAPARDEPWSDAEIETAESRVLARLEQDPRWPRGLQSRVKRTLCPTHFQTRYAAPGGAIYGRDSHGWKNAFLRPPNRNRRIRGLYHVGGSVHPGGGTPTVLMSARITSDEIRRFET